MLHKFRGLALIFNHKYFDNPRLTQRKRTEEDTEALSKELKRLHFKVNVHNDCILKEIILIVKETSQNVDHSDNDCILITVLSHGGKGRIYAKDTSYSPAAMWSCFTAENCPSLAGKPKWFLFQTCQGVRLDKGYVLENRSDTSSQKTAYKIPNEADFLFLRATLPRYASNIQLDGSCLMHALCKELNENGKSHDITRLLTIMAVDNEACKNHLETNKHLRSIEHRLTKKLIFTER